MTDYKYISILHQHCYLHRLIVPPKFSSDDFSAGAKMSSRPPPLLLLLAGRTVTAGTGAGLSPKRALSNASFAGTCSWADARALPALVNSANASSSSSNSSFCFRVLRPLMLMLILPTLPLRFEEVGGGESEFNQSQA